MPKDRWTGAVVNIVSGLEDKIIELERRRVKLDADIALLHEARRHIRVCLMCEGVGSRKLHPDERTTSYGICGECGGSGASRK